MTGRYATLEKAMGLLEQYIEATMIEKQDRYDEALQHRDEGRLLAAIQARAVREILHERLVILDDDHSVMDLVLDAIAAGGQGDGVLPSLALHPTLPDTPLRIDFGKDRLSFPDIPRSLRSPPKKEKCEQLPARLQTSFHFPNESDLPFFLASSSSSYSPHPTLPRFKHTRPAWQKQRSRGIIQRSFFLWGTHR